MAISTVTNRVELQGNGTSAVFAFPYRFHAQSDLAVFVYNSSLAAANVVAAKVLNTDYTISATANNTGVYPNGGNVVFNSTPNSQSVIVVFRSSVVTNAFTVGQNGAIPSSGLNNEIDYLTIIAQRLQDQITRGVRMADGFSGTFDPTLPPTLARVGSSTIMTNGQGTGLVMGPTADQIFGAASSAVAAAASAAAAAVSAGAAAADAVQTASAAVSCGLSVVLVNSAVTSIGNAVSLIGSTAFWGATAQSSAVSATNQAVLAGSAAVSAGNQVVLAGSAALSSFNSQVLANSAAVSAGNQAVLAGSAALSASNSAALAGIPTTPTSISAAYVALTSDQTVLCNSSNYTVRLYSTASQSGRTVTFVKTGSSAAGITIAGSGAATIAGLASVSLDFKDEAFTLITDGTDWKVKEWALPARSVGSNVILVGSCAAVHNAIPVFEVTKSLDGQWTFFFTMDLTHTSLSSPLINVGSGVLNYAQTGSFFQPITAYCLSSGQAINFARLNVDCTLQANYPGVATRTAMAGKMKLASKPLASL